jgi:Flp pilus assembly protein TadD
MNKENVIFTLCGFLLGLIGGTLLLGPALHARGVVPAVGMTEKVVAPAAAAALPADHPPVDAATTPGADTQAMQQVVQQIPLLKQRLESNPRDVEAAVQLGNMYMDARKYDQAISYYEKALAVGPNPDVATDVGICYRSKGDNKRALEVFRKVSAENPDHWQSRFNEAIVLMDTGELEAARAIVGDLQKKHPDDPDIKRFGELLTQMKKS